MQDKKVPLSKKRKQYDDSSDTESKSLASLKDQVKKLEAGNIVLQDQLASLKAKARVDEAGTARHIQTLEVNQHWNIYILFSYIFRAFRKISLS